ncbi:MFS transporter [Mycobacterium yunnanensis]|uniref:MFS transporter n=1 Tax=Mycobacterium yunnanensis TaxID=368477 RepID=A0A9X2YJH8_9MYCO|nr:MFS transporter [Mycobacterium yunnanensis]MCV7420417.1 MFS transporter [Mycobacterium yunnanensis]
MGTYRNLLRVPGVLNVTASQLFARLPLGILSLAILMHVHRLTGSYALAGTVVAAVGAGEAVAMPLTSRLAGRVGVARTLVTAATVNAVGTLGLAFAGAAAVPLMVLGVIVGASIPPLMPVVRALYPRMVPDDEVRTLFALDTTAQELIWVIGPVAATVLASRISTLFPLILCAAVTLMGTIWFLLVSWRLHPEKAVSESRFGRVLLHRAVILAMVSSLVLVGSFTALEVGIIAALGKNGFTAGAAIASASVGSLLGGLVFGHRRLGLSGVVVALSAVGVGVGLYGAADALPLQFAALFVSGVGFAPAMSALYLMVSREVGQHMATEAFGWLSSATIVGGSIGTAVAGVATDSHGPNGAVAVSIVMTVLAAVSPLVARAFGPLPGLAKVQAQKQPASCAT